MSLLQFTVFISVLSTALALIPTGAHAFELMNKMKLSKTEYQTVQQIYRGWNKTGLFEGISLLSSIGVVILAYENATLRIWAVIAVVSMIIMAIIFWFFTMPVNKSTNNWTNLPTNWKTLRNQWEYSHAIRAGCTLIALIASIIIGLNI